MVDNRVRKVILIVTNVVLIFTAVIFSWMYSTSTQWEQAENELDTFCATIESMKQVSDNYLQMELGYVKDWAKYISYSNMTMDEALEYINHANNQKDRYAHIVDMDTFEAYSSYTENDSNQVNCYKKFYEQETETDKIFIENMRRMFNEEDEYSILGKYRADDTQSNVISVGTGVTLRTEEGVLKEYLLLRIIPVESIRRIWVFPVQYESAEVGIITKSGSYVIPSKSMKSQSFSEFIRGYNYEEEYQKVDELIKQLSTTERGILRYKDSKGEECYWYYSDFGERTGIDILGYIPMKDVNFHRTNWTIVIVTCGVLFILTLLDGMYILHINARLRTTAEMAREASQAKTRFLSTMSHDIRTPMNGIIGMTNLARNHIGDDDYIRNCLDKISLASDHLLTLINDILDISKVESGNMALNPAPFSIEQSIEKLIDIVQTQVADKKINLTVDKNLPQKYLIADELRMNQIYINILNNAIKYTPQGGRIHVSIQEELLPDDRVRLLYRVEDSGIGMSEQFQQNMYQMFTREVDSKIDKTQGTGLGLAIVKQMVDMMKGTITCESEPNKGTTFMVTVELEQAAPEDYNRLNSISENSEDNNFEQIRVLAAEDNELNWEIINELLKEMHVFCDRAENGKECVEMIEKSAEGTYDLILMDVQMPLMDGKEATRRIRQSNREYVKSIMIVAMTADAFAEDVQACIEAGMNGHLSKPLDIRKICEVLRQAKQKKEKKL